MPCVILPQVQALAEAFNQDLRGLAGTNVTKCCRSILLPEGKCHLFCVWGGEGLHVGFPTAAVRVEF